MTYRILPIAGEHIEGFREVLDTVARERRYLAFLEAPPAAEVAKFVRGNIRRGYPQYVALVDGRVVGWCDVLPVDRPIKSHGGVLGMGILPEYRGQGIGTALIGATLAAARASGLTRVELVVREHNARARALYERLGFVQEGVKRNAVRVDAEYEDAICMALLFE